MIYELLTKHGRITTGCFRTLAKVIKETPKEQREKLQMLHFHCESLEDNAAVKHHVDSARDLMPSLAYSIYGFQELGRASN